MWLLLALAIFPFGTPELLSPCPTITLQSPDEFMVIVNIGVMHVSRIYIIYQCVGYGMLTVRYM
jgi:hypothetical protein